MQLFRGVLCVFINYLIMFIMKNNFSELEKAKIKHATSTVVAGILFILFLVRGMYLLSFLSLCLFIIGVSIYNSNENEKR